MRVSNLFSAHRDAMPTHQCLSTLLTLRETAQDRPGRSRQEQKSREIRGKLAQHCCSIHPVRFQGLMRDKIASVRKTADAGCLLVRAGFAGACVTLAGLVCGQELHSRMRFGWGASRAALGVTPSDCAFSRVLVCWSFCAVICRYF